MVLEIALSSFVCALKTCSGSSFFYLYFLLSKGGGDTS